MIDENVDNFLKKNTCCKHDKNNFDFLILTINIYINNLRNLIKQTYYSSFYQYLLSSVIIVIKIFLKNKSLNIICFRIFD